MKALIGQACQGLTHFSCSRGPRPTFQKPCAARGARGPCLCSPLSFSVSSAPDCASQRRSVGTAGHSPPLTAARRAPRAHLLGTFQETASGTRGTCGSLWGGSSLNGVILCSSSRSGVRLSRKSRQGASRALGFHKALCDHQWDFLHQVMSREWLTRRASALN